MINKIHYSPEALQDLDDIGDYIAEELSSPQAALSLLMSITSSIDLLENNPLMGPNLSAITDIVSDYRYLVVKKYLVCIIRPLCTPNPRSGYRKSNKSVPPVRYCSTAS